MESIEKIKELMIEKMISAGNDFKAKMLSDLHEEMKSVVSAPYLMTRKIESLLETHRQIIEFDAKDVMKEYIVNLFQEEKKQALEDKTEYAVKTEDTGKAEDDKHEGSQQETVKKTKEKKESKSVKNKKALNPGNILYNDGKYQANGKITEDGRIVITGGIMKVEVESTFDKRELEVMEQRKRALKTATLREDGKVASFNVPLEFKNLREATLAIIGGYSKKSATWRREDRSTIKVNLY